MPALSMKDLLTNQNIVLKAHTVEPGEYKRLEPNKYPAKLASLAKFTGPYGTSLKITFEVEQGSEVTRVTTFTSLSLFVGNETKPPSKLCQLFYAIKKRLPKPDEEIDLLTLPGNYCYIIVSDVVGKKYQAIKDFQPLETDPSGISG